MCYTLYNICYTDWEKMNPYALRYEISTEFNEIATEQVWLFFNKGRSNLATGGVAANWSSLPMGDQDPCLIQCYYLRQVNEMNGRDNVFIWPVCLCVRSGPVSQTSLKWELNANSSKFDTHVSRDSPDMTP